MSKKVLVVTIKPFAAKAVEELKKAGESAGYQIDLLESYSDKSQIINKLPGYDAMIIRSDKIDQEIINSSEDLKIIVRAGAGYDNVDLDSA
ncbi:MAG: 3-phosphoglycerate dehydrogenase, partial [Candidatus Aminicenantes bacterium]|nr:3-phosphoglycerate dehydrogenase [Candidatus Aminicenantes bacterium]